MQSQWSHKIYSIVCGEEIENLSTGKRFFSTFKGNSNLQLKKKELSMLSNIFPPPTKPNNRKKKLLKIFQSNFKLFPFKYKSLKKSLCFLSTFLISKCFLQKLSDLVSFFFLEKIFSKTLNPILKILKKIAGHKLYFKDRFFFSRTVKIWFFNL